MRHFTILVFLLLSITLVAQDESKPLLKDKLYTGGNIGLSGNFSNYFSFRISPLLGLKLTPKIYTGVGLEYSYTSDKRYTPKVSANDYGTRIFTQYNILPQFFAHAEYACYSYDSYYLNIKSDRVFVPYLLLGGGYRKQINSRSFFSLRVLFDVIQDGYSPYEPGQPYISVGFGINL